MALTRLCAPASDPDPSRLGPAAPCSEPRSGSGCRACRSRPRAREGLAPHSDEPPAPEPGGRRFLRISFTLRQGARLRRSITCPSSSGGTVREQPRRLWREAPRMATMTIRAWEIQSSSRPAVQSSSGRHVGCAAPGVAGAGGVAALRARPWRADDMRRGHAVLTWARRGVAALGRDVRAAPARLHRVAAARARAAAGPLRVAGGAVRDVVRPRAVLALENAALRAQLESAARQGRLRRSRPTRGERLLLAALLPRLPGWKEVCFLVQPATVLRWHRHGWKILWAYRSRRRPRPRRRVADDVVALVRDMGTRCPFWGAERIRGQLLQLEVGLSKRTIQRVLAEGGPRPSGPTWGAFWPSSIRPSLRALARRVRRLVRRLLRLLELLGALLWAARGRPGAAGEGGAKADDAAPLAGSPRPSRRRSATGRTGRTSSVTTSTRPGPATSSPS